MGWRLSSSPIWELIVVGRVDAVLARRPALHTKRRADAEPINDYGTVGDGVVDDTGVLRTGCPTPSIQLALCFWPVADGGGLIANGCDFADAGKTQIVLEPGLAVVSSDGNCFRGEPGSRTTAQRTCNWDSTPYSDTMRVPFDGA